MPSLVSLNGRIIASDEARISPLGEGFMYGRGLFETIKVLRGNPIFFEDHLARLLRSAAALGLPYATSATDLRARAAAVITANALAEGSLKIVVFQDTDGIGELIVTRPGSYAPDLHVRGFKLKIFPDIRRPGDLSEHKTLNYLKNSSARASAKAGGFDEALFVDPSDAILEGAVTNVFAVSKGEVLTPPLTAGILPGIMRAKVLEILGEDLAREQTLALPDLLTADEVFVTNSLMGVMPVALVERQGFSLTANPATRALMDAIRRQEIDV